MSRFPTELEVPTAEVTPGEPLHGTLRISNPAEAVDEFSVVGLGVAADWVSTEPPTLPLMPQTDGELAVTVLIPAHATVEVGTHTLRLQIRSALDAAAVKAEELVIDVQQVTRWDVEVEPSTQRSKKAVTYAVQLTNDSNHALRVTPSAVPSSNDLAIRLSHAVVDVPAFQTATATLEITAPRHTGGDDLHHHIDVQAHVDGTPPKSRRAAFVQQPRISRWRLLLVIAAVVILLAAALAVEPWL